MQIVEAVTRDCFNAVFKLQHAATSGSQDIAAVQAQICDPMDRMIGRALACGLDRDAVYDIVFALASLADALSSRDKGPLAIAWKARPVVDHYFGDAADRESFLDRVTRLRKGGRHDVLRVYASCLAFGLRAELRQPQAQELLGSLVEEIEPRPAAEAERPATVFTPLWNALGRMERWQWLPAGALMACGALYVILSSSMRGEISELEGIIDNLLTLTR